MFGTWRGNTSLRRWRGIRTTVMRSSWWISRAIFRVLSAIPCANGNTPKNELGDLPAVPVKLVHINKCPVLAQANTLRPEERHQWALTVI
jgi:exodeoxyribonuclease-1